MGSTSKAMNGFVISRLAEQGILNMTRPVVDYRPSVRFNDSTTTLNANFVDLLSHQTGLPRADLAIEMFNNTGDFLDNHVRYLEPSYKFRDGAEYQNHMHALAGLVASDVYQCNQAKRPTSDCKTNDFKNWYAMMKAELFDPLNMTRTTGDLGLWMEDELRSDSASSSVDTATGIPILEFSWDDPMVSVDFSWVAPAEAVSTNAEDLVKYLKFLLKKGASENGTQVLSPEAFSNSFVVHNPSFSYGLGWAILPYRGKSSYWHNGGTTMTCGVRIFPEDSFGVFVLTNNSVDWGAPALNHIIDRLLFGDDSNTAFSDAEQEKVNADLAYNAAVAQAYESLPTPLPLPTINSTAFLGTYENGV
ncbi:beta-lactamase/transpeptidase-like protein [Cladochytrium replicatum]|nr:beta-lactamase/transpeptidase-like protein [Cladochytrium replicatum]